MKRIYSVCAVVVPVGLGFGLICLVALDAIAAFTAILAMVGLAVALPLAAALGSNDDSYEEEPDSRRRENF